MFAHRLVQCISGGIPVYKNLEYREDIMRVRPSGGVSCPSLSTSHIEASGSQTQWTTTGPSPAEEMLGPYQAIDNISVSLSNTRQGKSSHPKRLAVYQQSQIATRSRCPCSSRIGSTRSQHRHRRRLTEQDGEAKSAWPAHRRSCTG